VTTVATNAAAGVTPARITLIGKPGCHLCDDARAVIARVAAELGVGDFDLYVKTAPAAAGSILLRVEPGNPSALIIGEVFGELGSTAMRFAAARALRLAATHFDAILAVF